MSKKKTTLGQRITAGREKLKLNRRQFGIRCGLNDKHVGELEADRYPDPTMPTLRKLARVLGCDWRDLAD